MSDTTPFGFGRFVPGFDFLQNLAKGAAAGMPAMPGLSGWVAPTMSVEELDKRIQDLKAVQFWLEQNARALAATVQALEVQKMTLATLKDMNVAMGDLAASLGGGASDSKGPTSARSSAPPSAPPPSPKAAPASAQGAAARGDQAPQPGGPTASNAQTAVDPMQWWGALTSQFQQIAAHAMQDAGAHQAAFDATREMASGAFKTASGMAAQMAAQGMQGMRAAAQAASGATPSASSPGTNAKPAAKTGERTASGAAGKTSSSSKRSSTAPRASATKTAAAPRARRPAG